MKQLTFSNRVSKIRQSWLSNEEKEDLLKQESEIVIATDPTRKRILVILIYGIQPWHTLQRHCSPLPGRYLLQMAKTE